MVGFADHAAPESSLRFALAATALGAGARVFEKHLTLGEIMKMEDHEAALNPDRFAEFVAVLRDCARAYGSCGDRADFGMSESEQAYREMIRRHVVSNRPLASGARIEPGDVVLKRTSSSIPLTELARAYGATAMRDIAANEALSPIDLSDGSGNTE